MCQSLCLEEVSAVGAGYAKHSEVCVGNQLGQRKECMSLLPSLSAWSWRWGHIARPGNKIISLSDGPPLGLAHSRFPIGFIVNGIQAGGSGVQSEGDMQGLVQQRLQERKGCSSRSPAPGEV